MASEFCGNRQCEVNMIPTANLLPGIYRSSNQNIMKKIPWHLSHDANSHHKNFYIATHDAQESTIISPHNMPTCYTISNLVSENWVTCIKPSRNRITTVPLVSHGISVHYHSQCYSSLFKELTVDHRHGRFPLESLEVCGYISNAVLLESETYSQNSVRSQHRKKDCSLYNILKRQSRICVSSRSVAKHSSFAQHKKFTISPDNCSHGVRSGHEPAKIESPSAHKDTSRQKTMVSRISPILRSLSSLSLSRNLSPIPTDEPDPIIISSPQRRNNIHTPRDQEESKSKLIDDGKVITEMDGNISISFEPDHKLIESISSRTQETLGSSSKKENPGKLLKILSLVSIALNFFLIGPLVVIYWNNTWTIFDHYLFSDNPELSTWTSAAIGFSVMAAATILQDKLLFFSVSYCKPARHIIMRIYTYVVSVACINQWRSVWMIVGCYAGHSMLNSSVSLASALVVLILLRCLQSIPAPPVFLALDVPHAAHYKAATFLGSPPSGSLHFILDSLVTVFVVQVSSITCWRGFWEILDFCLFPENHHMSAIYSVGISLGLSFILLSLRIPIQELSRCLYRINWLLMLAFQDVVTLLYSVVCITYWRGIWMLLILYSPYRPESLFVAHGVSFVILAMCLAANSLLVRDVQRDGMQSCDYALKFDMGYVSNLQKTWRSNKETKYSVRGEPKLIPTSDNAEDPVSININS